MRRNSCLNRETMTLQKQESVCGWAALRLHGRPSCVCASSWSKEPAESRTVHSSGVWEASVALLRRAKARESHHGCHFVIFLQVNVIFCSPLPLLLFFLLVGLCLLLLKKRNHTRCSSTDIKRCGHTLANTSECRCTSSSHSKTMFHRKRCGSPPPAAPSCAPQSRTPSASPPAFSCLPQSASLLGPETSAQLA